MPKHPRAAEARSVFNAIWHDGDIERGLNVLSDDVVWRNDIGAGPLRLLEGKAQVLAMQLWWFEFFDGTFRHELIDVCASDDRVIEVLHEIGMKDGVEFDNLALYVYEVNQRDPNRYRHVQTFDRDRANIEAFWSNFPTVLAADPLDLIHAHLPA